ncbi:MAG: ABC transporter permease [Colwellia sp.]
MSLLKKALFNGVVRIFSLPRLSIPLILTLGLTLGAVLSVIAISSTLLYQPLQGIKNENKLQTFEYRLNISESIGISYWNMNRLVAFSDRFADVGEWAGISPSEQDVTINETRYTTTSYKASNNILAVLGSKLLLGENVTMASPEKYVWISNSLWQSAYDGANSVLGKPLNTNKKNYLIAGVIEDVMAINSSDKILNQQVWFIRNLDDVRSQEDNVGNFNNEIDFLIVKSADGQANLPTQAQTDEWLIDYVTLNAKEENLEWLLDFLASNNKEVISDSYRTNMLGETAGLMLALFSAVIGLLFMATLNLLNLFIAHYQGRTKEFAIQISVGASLLKMRSLVLIENLPSFLLAAIIGLLVTGWALKGLPLIAGDSIPMIDAISINSTTIAAAVAIILMLSVLFSALALVDIDKIALANNLNSSGKGLQAQSNQWLSRVLMVVQLAIASVLLTASVMISVQSYQAVYQPLGYELGNSYNISFSVNDEEYSTQLEGEDEDSYQTSEIKRLLAEVSTFIESKVADSQVVIADVGPLSNNIQIRFLKNQDNNGEQVFYQVKILSHNYFSTFNIPFLVGANLTQMQIDNDEERVVIDEHMAKTLFPLLSNAEIIGKTVQLRESSDHPPAIITGIVANTLSRTGVSEPLGFPVVYPHRIYASRTLDFTVMMPEGKTITADMFTTELNRQFPRLSNVQVSPLSDLWQEQTLNQRISLWVVIAMTGLTLFLAAIGVAGLTQMTTNHRKYELAVRMATGAKQMKLINFIVKDALLMLVIGLGLGFIASVLSYQHLATELDMLPSFNWLAMSLLDVGLILIVLLSVMMPAWRVISADPMQALRCE